MSLSWSNPRDKLRICDGDGDPGELGAKTHGFFEA